MFLRKFEHGTDPRPLIFPKLNEQRFAQNTNSWGRSITEIHISEDVDLNTSLSYFTHAFLP